MCNLITETLKDSNRSLIKLILNKNSSAEKATAQDGALVSHACALGTCGERAHVLVYAGKLALERVVLFFSNEIGVRVIINNMCKQTLRY